MQINREYIFKEFYLKLRNTFVSLYLRYGCVNRTHGRPDYQTVIFKRLRHSVQNKRVGLIESVIKSHRELYTVCSKFEIFAVYVLKIETAEKNYFPIDWN